MSHKILVVDDEQSIVTLLQFNLEKEGYQVITAFDGEEALEKARMDNPDFIILDIMLPKLDGIEVCKKLRQDDISTPILMLTAKADEFDKVLGLELGADDYITKPFSPREVIARIKAIFRRTQVQNQKQNPKDQDDKIVIGLLEIYPEQYEAYFDQGLLELTPKEFELLHYLARNKGRVLSRDQLLNVVWNYEYMGDTRIVDVHISHLREKVNKEYIKTVRGVGYKMEDIKK